jgi:ABC-2 type transport system permease protein
VTLLLHQLRFERKLFRRNPSAAFFNFVLPLVLLLLVASVFADDDEELEVLIPGIAGMSIMATTFTALAFNMVFLREQGILKRIRGTPVPSLAYLGGLISSAVINAVVQVVLVFAIGKLVYGVDLPDEPLAVLVYAITGVAAFAALGIAFSHAIPNFDAAGAYTNAVFLPVIFISGVFYSTDDLPRALEVIGTALPLTHVIDGLAGDGLSAGLGVVVGWGALGAILAVRYFRWD